MTGVRQEYRDLCADLVRVEWEVKSGQFRSEWATLEDISPSGACLQIEEPLLPNTSVRLHFSNENCQACVKHCTFDKIGYFVGVEFEQGYRWSRRKFRPRHLLQFRLRTIKGCK